MTTPIASNVILYEQREAELDVDPEQESPTSRPYWRTVLRERAAARAAAFERYQRRHRRIARAVLMAPLALLALAAMTVVFWKHHPHRRADDVLETRSSQESDEALECRCGCVGQLDECGRCPGCAAEELMVGTMEDLRK